MQSTDNPIIVKGLDENGRRLSSKIFEEKVQAAFKKSPNLHLETYGQHNVGGRLLNADNPVNIRVSGPVGQRLGAMARPGSTIYCDGPASDDVGYLNIGADIIVNTDADNQYPGRYIPELVAPVLAGTVDIVIANRQIENIPHFSPFKKFLQRLGSWTVRTVSNTDVPDAVSGFRAYSRDTALRLNILTSFSYTLDTIIQAGKLGLIIQSIPVETNDPIRPSRLQRSMGHFIKAQASTIIRLYAFYEPLRTFSYIALPFILSGLGLWGRFFYAYLNNAANQFIQSVTIGTGLLLVGLLIFLFGVQADITSKHRQMTQETLYRLKKLELGQKHGEEERSEERRVGKECRSRWSPYH